MDALVPKTFDLFQSVPKIENLKYEPTLKRQLREFSISDVLSGRAFSHGSFNLNFKDSIIGVSHWVSPKRTHSYPYARVYDTMNAARRVTIIPFLKDEGKDGDRDFIQWDTVSLMSLLGVYVILGYYAEAQKNDAFDNKITEQEFDYAYLKARLEELSTYKSDALHWNLNELKKISSMLPNSANTITGASPKRLASKCKAIRA